MSRIFTHASRRNLGKGLVAFFAFACFCFTGQQVVASTGSLLGSVLDRQDAWLATSTEGEAWNKFLLTEELREQLNKPRSQVDRRMVAKILGRYNSETSGLEHANFAATRQALTHWANDNRVALAVRWSEEIRARSKNLAPIEDECVQKARNELREATGALNQMLNMADSTTRDGWKRFLKWDDLDESLMMGTPNWKSLQQVGGQFFNGHPGLEYPEFVRVRNALRKYIYLGQGSPRAVESQMQELAKALDRYNKEPSTKNAGEVAALVDWLNQLDRCEDIAPQIRSAHSLPNMKLRVSENLLTRRFSQDVREPITVNENILGTHVIGNALTTGRITTDIVRNPNVARIDIVFRGAAHTRSVGRQKPVTIHSTSATGLEARKPLYVYPNQVTTAPARASARTNTTIHSIVPDNRLGRRIVEKIAWKRAGKQKGQTEQVASERTARRLEQQIDEKSQELLTRAQVALREQLNGPINRRGLLPEDMRTLSLDSCAVVLATQATPSQFASTTRPPDFCPHDDVVAQVHESAFNNTAEKAIAGLTLTDERIAEITKDVTGSIPEELQINDEKTPWSISFAWNQPVTVEFDNETLKVAIRARRLTSGERALEFGRPGSAKFMEISASYTMQVNPTGVQLTRQGGVDVSFEGRKKIGVKERIFKALMEKKFAEVFKPEIQGEGFSLPGQFADIGTIRVNDMSAEDGWLSVGWK